MVAGNRPVRRIRGKPPSAHLRQSAFLASMVIQIAGGNGYMRLSDERLMRLRVNRIFWNERNSFVHCTQPERSCGTAGSFPHDERIQ